MRLSARSEYGLLALVDLTVGYGAAPVAARDLAETRGIPQAFLEQLLADLRRAGLVRATRGTRGGFTLGRSPAEITALDIVEALEGPIEPSVCTRASCGAGEHCAALSVWSDVSDSIRAALGSFTLDTLATRQASLDRTPLTCTSRKDA